MAVERDQLPLLGEADTPSGHQVITPSPPWRALVVGTLLLPLLTHFGHLSYIIAQSAVWTAQTLLRGPVLLLFLLVCWSLAWRRVSPRLARWICLSRQEMILVYLMMT